MNLLNLVRIVKCGVRGVRVIRGISALMIMLVMPGVGRAQDSATDDSPEQAEVSVEHEEAAAQTGATADTEQREGAKEEQILVTATRIQTPSRQIGSSFTVITSDMIQRRQATHVADVLRQVPGLDIVRAGGIGQITSIFTRGTNSNHTLVLIDGVEASDPSAFGGAFNFANMTVDNVERIEILRGPQSSIWGSDAIGGVINIITRRGAGKPTFYFSAEGGSFATFRETVGFSGEFGMLSLAASLSRIDSDGISTADDDLLGNDEDDGYENTSFSTRVGITPTDQLDIDFVVRVVDAKADIDTFGGAGGDALGRTLDSTELFIKVEPTLLLFDDVWEQKFAVAFTNVQRRDNMGFIRNFDGDRLKLTWQNNLYLADWITLTLGAEHERERFKDDTTSREAAEITSFFFQEQVKLGESLFVTAGGRVDRHDEFGSEFTYRIAPAYLIKATGTKIKGSYGTGFRAPSLPELLGPFGNPKLDPETSRGWDIGVEQTLFGEQLTVGATYIKNDIDDLVAGFPLDNIGNADTQGVELFFQVQPASTLAIRGGYTYLDTDDGTGQDLIRRAANKFSLDVNCQIMEKANVTLGIVFVDEREDINFNVFPSKRVTLDDYTLVSLSGSYDISDNIRLFGRIENMLNENYQEVFGFGSPGIAAFAGLRVTF